MARPPGRLWWRLSSDLLVGDTRSWPETSPETIEVSKLLRICCWHEKVLQLWGIVAVGSVYWQGFKQHVGL